MKGKVLFKTIRLIIFICLFFQFGKTAYGQTDTQFWFVVPDVTYGHNDSSTPRGGEPGRFTFAALDLDASLVISMPANPSFVPISITVPAHKSVSFDVSDFINMKADKVTKAAIPKDVVNIIENGYNDNMISGGVFVPNKAGIKIESINNAPVTAYYIIENYNNTEIYSLKGRNALGSKFFTPFQTRRDNGNYAPTPYSSINVVATVDGTVVRITPKVKAFIHGDIILPNTTYTVTLKAGETVCVVPATAATPDKTAANRLAGTLVESDPDHPIAITVNDDSIYGLGGSYDTAGDQLVNLSSLGKEYVILSTDIYVSSEEDYYVTATEDNTTITVKHGDGRPDQLISLAKAGDFARILITPVGSSSKNPYDNIKSDKAVSVFQIGGFGREIGGAILPAVDKCTGSYEVAFNKLNESGKTFNVNIMVRTERDAAGNIIEAQDGRDKFKINISDFPTQASINLANIATTKATTVTAQNKGWIPVGGDPNTAVWWFIQIKDWNKAKTANLIDVAGSKENGNILINEGNLFHFGVFYGNAGSGCNYGYFSDFNVLKPSASVAGVLASQTKVCFGTPIQLLASGGNSYQWTPAPLLNDSKIKNPIANIPTPGPQKFTVSISGACGMTVSRDVNVEVFPPVDANFSVDKNSGCSPLEVNFTNSSLNAAELKWNFGDGTAEKISTNPAEVFKHTFVNTTANPITYTVKLTIKSASECPDTVSKKITVYPSDVAVLSRTESVVNFCSPRSVEFHNETVLNALAPTDVSYTWDYGDGVSEKTNNLVVNHDFSVINQSKKRHTVTLTMINKYGCRSVATDTIDVYGKVNAFFDMDKVSGCPNPNFNAVLTDASVGVNLKKTWTWDGFTHAQVSTSPDVYNVSVAGGAAAFSKTIGLSVVGPGGCSDRFEQKVDVYPYVNALFNIADNRLCDGDILNIINTSSAGSTDFLWEFGDGGTSTDKNPTHIYNNASYAQASYTVRLTAKSPEGCTNVYTAPAPVTVGSRIEPNFVVKNLGGCAPFNATITNTSKGNLTNKYEWDFKDGSPVLVENKFIADRTHLFANTTTDILDYMVDLKVTNESGCSESISNIARVYPQPVADFTVDKNAGCNPLPVKFTASTNVVAYDYLWHFGDGTNALGSTLTHTYSNFDGAANKTFDPVLNVTSIYGCSATVTKPVTVYPYLKAGFTVEQLSNCTPFDVKITPTSVGATSYQWNFGNGTSTVTSSAPFNVTYDNTTAVPISYTISMVATNAAGACQSTAVPVAITVDPRVVVDGTFTVDDKCTGAVTFGNTSAGAVKYTWDFGDGQSVTTTAATPVKHTYINRTAADIVYKATLTAENAKGCKQVKSFDVTIVPRVESSFALDVIDKCTPMKVSIVNSSLNGSEFIWDYGHTIGGVVQVETRATKDPFQKTFTSEDLNNKQTYTIQLKVVDNITGCFATSQKDLDIYPVVVPNFTADVVDKCTGEVKFTNLTTGANTYTWAYGDPSSAYTTSTLDPVTHVYLNRAAADLTFTAKLVATNAIGCSNTVSKDVTIVPRVEAGFTMEEKGVCTPVKVTFTNASLNGSEFTWDYGYSLGGIAQKDIKTDKLPFDKVIDSESANAIQTYPITLTVADKSTGCNAAFTRNLVVHPRVIPSFTADKDAGCSDFTVNLTNTSTGGNMAYSWDFKDGESAKTAALADAVSHTYVNRTSATKTYNLELTATNTKGCSAVFTKPINVYPKVEAAFAFVQNSKCTPFPIDITNGSLNGNEYVWDFGHSVGGVNRDTTTTTKNGFRTYIYNGDVNSTQTYTLKLTARDKITGCSAEATKTIVAQPEVKSQFGVSVDKGCNPLTVSFTNNSTGSSSYMWDFGNKTSSANASPSAVTYVNNDTVKVAQYNIVLTAKNADGCISTSNYRVDVYPKVMADFSFDKVEGCTPLAVKVNNVYPSSAYRYEWDLGSNGQNTGQQIPALNFINSTADFSIQKETIKLKVLYKGDAACYKEVVKSINVFPGTRSDFSMDVTEACNPLAVNFKNNSQSYSSSASYSWSFGNLGSSASKNPSYTFTNLSHTQNQQYTVKLKSVSVHGCKDSTTKTVVVRPVPRAQIAINTSTGCAPFKVDIQNMSEGVMPTYKFWLDNDRANAIERNGTSNVQFTIDNLDNTTKETVIWHKVISDFGCVDSISQKVYTFPHVKSEFTFSPSDAGCSPLSVDFVNTSKNASYFTWDFADGVTAHINSPNHLFHNFDVDNKTFDVKLTVKSEFGCENSFSKVFTVYSSPEAFFTIDPPLRIYPDASFLFTNKTQPVAPNWTYEWSFGDGGTYVGMNPPVYVYKTWAPDSQENKYFVNLKVSNGHCKDEMTQFLYLKPAVPIAIFTSTVAQSCAPLETQFTHQAKYYNAIEWDFGDGTKSTEDSPKHTYKAPGKYYVRLSVKGDGGTTYAYTTLDVFQNPVASFKFAPAEAMLPEAKVHFYNTSTDGATYYWDFGDTFGMSTEKSPEYIYKKLGDYDVHLTTTSENGCVHDTLMKAAVKVIGEGLIKFPNAFIPNINGGNGGAYEMPDYKNEVFHPVSAGIVTYRLLIYNRWGERLFESNDINVGWDGYYKSKLCEQGVYVYRATGRYTNGKTFDVRGDVTLLR